MKPIPIEIGINQISQIFEEFIDLADRNAIENRGLARRHKFYPAIDFYLNNKKDWDILNIPKFVMQAANDMGHFVVVLKQLLVDSSKGKPTRSLLRVDLIESLCSEVLVASNYVRRGYAVAWPSIFKSDPPDLIVYDRKNKIKVDIEIKLREQKPSVETMFDSLSRGLQSLKRRKIANARAIVAIHNSEDLDWEKWLSDPDVKKRLTSRLENDEYKLISGIIFSGGEIVEEGGKGERQYSTRLVAFRSNAATHQLPVGFLTGSNNL